MALSNTHKIPEIQKLLKLLEEEANSQRGYEHYSFARGIDYCVKCIREIIDSA